MTEVSSDGGRCEAVDDEEKEFEDVVGEADIGDGRASSSRQRDNPTGITLSDMEILCLVVGMEFGVLSMLLRIRILIVLYIVLS